MNWSAVPSASLAGKALRLPLKLIPRDAVVPILGGPLAGARWIVGASSHGCWLGSYEHDKQRLFASHVAPGATVFDVGANVGFYTLLASRRAGAGGRVVAFEPVPRNLGYLRRHLDLNHAANVEVIEAAVSDRDGRASFDDSPGASMGRLDDAGRLRVRTMDLDTAVSSGALPVADVVKIDVEGAEERVLDGARAFLARHRPTIFLATHSPALHRRCCDLLSELGYELRPLSGAALEASDEILATAPA